jgi:tetratricopeptide (TPR) repeat protein
MYTITFYSFKGGVGRTMAMANVGLSLARAGRRVLLVDFDLEAPGLDTFDLLRPPEPTCGVVDFVDEYRKSRIAPDVKKFIYEPPHEGLKGKVWVMPTGKQDAGYGQRLNSIDWRQLYAEEDGYLLFEDLKQQWASELSPDYVLIDSRTGHTDVGGICTRQLPDAVALLFFPNEQNRRGLEVVMRDIRLESQESERTIELFFVASNVPDLDDEHRILRDRLREFEKTFGGPLHAKIHHYDSLSLLQQNIFTMERPHTKLAREYESLRKRVTSLYLEDRDVAIEFLESVNRGAIRQVPPDDVDRRLLRIKELYSGDGPVVYSLAQATRSLGREKDAQELFSEAAQLGFLPAERMAEEAAAEYARGAIEQARDLVRKALELPGSHVFAIERLLSTVVTSDVTVLPSVLRRLAKRGLGPQEKLYLAPRLQFRKEALPAIQEFLRPLNSSTEPGIHRLARIESSLCLIGQKRFDDALAFLLEEVSSLSELGIQDSFNYAMAEWGRTGTPSKEPFLVVISLDARGGLGNLTANYFQCLSLANWAVGRREEALQLLEKSRGLQSTQTSPLLEFSAWRYLRVTPDEFLRDLDAQESMILTGVGQPLLFSGDA